MLTAPTVLSLAVLAILPFLMLLSVLAIVMVTLTRMRQTVEMTLKHNDLMARKLCSMSEKPPAQQLAMYEAARSLSHEAGPQDVAPDEFLAGQ